MITSHDLCHIDSHRALLDMTGVCVCRHWTQKGAVAWLLNTQLCPLIWALILSLLAMLVYKVSPSYPTRTLSQYPWL